MSSHKKPFSKAKPSSKRNKIVALAVMLVVATAGYTLVASRAAGFFASVDPSTAVLTGNALVITESDGTKTLQFKAPATPPPPSGSTSCPLPKYPNANCTGLPAGPPLTDTLDGQININTANTILERKLINGCIVVNAPNVIIRQVVINCATGDGIYNNSTGLLIEDVDISCDDRVGGTGITWQNYTARRVNVHDCDNVMWAEHNVVIEDSYIHDPICYNKKTDPHTDSIQIPAGGSNITIRHNTIYGNYEMCDEDNDGNLEQSFGNSAITTGSGLSNLLITNNLLAGGGYTLRCAEDGKGSTNYRVIDNHFSTIFTPKIGGFGPWNDCQNETQVTNNIYHESGLPVPF